jgi:hypothetical protein
MATAQPPPAPPVLTPLQASTPLRASALWPLQDAFYKGEGVSCWKGGRLPFFVTSNAFVASCYARTVMGFLRDWLASSPVRASSTPPPRAACMHVLELGAGHGRLSFLVLRELLDLWALEHGGAAEPPPVRFVVTDVAPWGPAFWAAHESLARFVAAGLLDFAVFDAAGGGPLRLTVSGEVLAPGSLSAPVVALANYVFDTLRADNFRCVDGALQQAHAALFSSDPADAPAAPDEPLPPSVVPRLSAKWTYEPTTCVAPLPC